jgi:hypothetical protein
MPVSADPDNTNDDEAIIQALQQAQQALKQKKETGSLQWSRDAADEERKGPGQHSQAPGPGESS